MGKIKDMTTAKAEDLQMQLAAQARVRYYSQIMEWESCSYEEAIAFCSDPTRPDYRLGFKMCDPLMQMAMHMQVGKKARTEAVAKFKSGLQPDELEIFEKDVETTSMGKAFREAMRRKKKN